MRDAVTSDRRPTLDQRRARHAWDAVARVQSELGGKDAAKDYAREAKRLPVRIRTAGLGHALAFLRAKSGQANECVLRDLDSWVLRERKLPSAHRDAPCLMAAITQGDSEFLQLATDEALAYLQWLTRFAEAEFGTDES